MNALRRTIFIKSVPWLLAMLSILILAGCAMVGPNYVPPDTPVSPTWHSQLKGGLMTEEMDPKILAGWWATLNDPELSNLIDRAVAGNLDLKKAWARVREARARRGLAKSDLFPTLDAAGSATWSRSSKDTVTGKTSDLYSASFDAGWELDIFGGVRRSVEAAEADLGAKQEDLHDVLVSLLAEVAVNYLDVRTFQVRLAVAEANLQAQSETYQLAQWRYEAGLSDELTVQQARYNLENTRSQIPTLRTGLEEAMNRIAVLLGEQPGKLHAELEKREPIPVTPLNVAVGVPADLLRRRPDVRQAERQLAAQTARIGVATADLYPKFTLSGSIGLEALSLNNLSSGIWTLSGGPRISWAIFKAGAIRQNIEVQSALQEQYLIAYETAVLSALEEVENALVAYAEEQQRRQSLSEATQAAQKAVELAQHKYQAGLTDFSNVLDAQRSLLSFQDQLAQSDGTVTSNLVRLYKALGGGWTSMAPDEKK
jgi:multidrug efflux system outer membrane protein